MSSAAFFAFALLFVVAVSAHDHSSSSAPGCDQVQPLQNAETTRLAGNWFAVQGHDPENTIKCFKESTRVNADGIFSSEVEFTSPNGQTSTYSSTGTPVGGQKSKLSFVHSTDPAHSETARLLDTDYDHYMIWETCKTVNGNPQRLVLIMSRQNNLEAQYVESATQAIRNKNINVHLNPLEQNC